MSPDTHTTPADQQIKTYLHYCQYSRQHTSDTIKTKYYHIRQFVRETHVNDLRFVTNDAIDEWRATSLDAGKKPKTINGHIDDVVGCLKFLKNRKNEAVDLNFDAVERYRVTGYVEDLPAFEPADIQRIKQACEGLRERLVISLIFETALRIHELTKLQTNDIHDDPDGTYVRIEGKGRRKRNTFILPATKKLLDHWLTVADIRQGYIFPSPYYEDRPISIEVMRKVVTRPIRRAGFEIGGPHAMRRSAVTIALENGMPLQDVAGWAGHSNPKVTLEHYYRANRQHMMREHNKAMSVAA